MAKLKIEVEIEDAYNVEEAAAALHVGVATIWRWIKSRKLASVKLQGRTLIPIKEVERLKTARTPQGKGALTSIGGE